MSDVFPAKTINIFFFSRRPSSLCNYCLVFNRCCTSTHSRRQPSLSPNHRRYLVCCRRCQAAKTTQSRHTNLPIPTTSHLDNINRVEIWIWSYLSNNETELTWRMRLLSRYVSPNSDICNTHHLCVFAIVPRQVVMTVEPAAAGDLGCVSFSMGYLKADWNVADLFTHLF